MKELQEILLLCDRKNAGKTAPAHGLYLEKVVLLWEIEETTSTRCYFVKCLTKAVYSWYMMMYGIFINQPQISPENLLVIMIIENITVIYDRIRRTIYMRTTFMAKGHEVERKWLVVDAEGQTLGRLASEVALSYVVNINQLSHQTLIQEIM